MEYDWNQAKLKKLKREYLKLVLNPKTLFSEEKESKFMQINSLNEMLKKLNPSYQPFFSFAQYQSIVNLYGSIPKSIRQILLKTIPVIRNLKDFESEYNYFLN